MTLKADDFRAYFKKHKLAREGIVDEYMREHPQEEYQYEDIDAVYQRQVEETISRKEVHSQSERRAGGSHSTYAMGGWVNSMTYCNRGSRTISGVGHSDPRYGS